jgi:hypothetical protein
MAVSASMIDSTILPAKEYNEILDFDENRSKLLHRVHPSVLVSLGNIFAKHGVSSHFGIHLLHRHFLIPDNTVMVYTSGDPDVEICQVTSVDAVAGKQLRGRNLRLNKSGRFQAYEYDIGEDFEHRHEFLAELAAHIIKHCLQDYVALEYDSTPDDKRHRAEFIFNDKALIKVRGDPAKKLVSRFTDHPPTYITQDIT